MWLPALVTLATFILFCATICPTVPFGDGGELIAAAACLGVAHPPGYPLYTVLNWLALKIPFGEPALRTNLLSSLFAALACGAAAWFLLRATGSRVAAASGALSLAVSSTFWWVAVVTEVYSLHLLLILILLCAALAIGTASEPGRRRRPVLVAAAALGLGLAHHPTIVLVLPAAALLAFQPGERPRRPSAEIPLRWFAAALALAVALPVIFDVGLMLRARADPPSNWGRPVSLESLWHHVTAAAYRHFDLGWSGLARAESWRRLMQLLLNELTPAVLPLAALGLAGWPRSERAPSAGRLRFALGALIVASALFGLRYAAEDVEVFYLPAFLGLALAGGLGVARLTRHPRISVARAGLAAAVLVVLVPAATHAPSRQLSGMTGAADYGRDILRTVPPNGVLFVEVDDAFMVLYLHQVLGERPDVTVYDRNGVLFHDLVPELRLPPLQGEPGRDYRIRVEQTFIDRELTQQRSREILFLGWPGYDVPPRYRLEPVGLLYRICRATEPVLDDAPIWAGYHADELRAQARRTDNSFALAIAATYPLARGERRLFLGDRAAAYAAFDEASLLAGRTAGVHNYIGTLYGRLGDYDRAIAAFRRSLSIKPFSVRAWNNLAMAHARAGDAENARRAWKRSLELVPGQADVVASLSQLEPARR